MIELLRRLWRAFSYDPVVEYQRAKDLLVRRLASPESEKGERPESK